MKFHFDLSKAAYNNSPGARRREGTRMAIIARCLQRFGHEATISGAAGEVRGAPLWEAFADLEGAPAHSYDAHVAAAEHPMMPQCRGAMRVAFKTSTNLQKDSWILGNCDVYFAQEYNVQQLDNKAALEHSPKLLPVSWFAFHTTIEQLHRDVLLRAYIDDDLGQIRRVYGGSGNKIPKAAYCGVPYYGRSQWASMMPKELCEFQWIQNGGRLAPGDYLRWLSKFRAGIQFAGATPKANRFAELVMLGLAVVMVRCPMRDIPRVTAENVILLRDWDDRDELGQGLMNAGKIVAAADAAYREGWGPMGQARQLVKKLEELS